MIAVLASVVVILAIAGTIWLRSRKRTDEEPQALEGAPAAGALAAADSGDEAGAESGEPASAAAEPAPTSAEPGAPADAGAAPADAADAGAAPAGAAPAGGAPATPDLLTDAEQISEEEIAAGRTAALKKMLEERGKQ